MWFDEIIQFLVKIVYEMLKMLFEWIAEFCTNLFSFRLTSVSWSFWLVLLAAVSGGAIWVFAKIVLQYMDPLTFTWWRFLFAILSMTPFILFDKRQKKIPLRIRIQGWSISLLATANVLFFAFGVERTTAMIAQVVYVLLPIIVLCLGILFLRKRYSWGIWRGVFLWLLWWVLIISLPIIYGTNSLRTGTITWNFLVLGWALCFSIYLMLSYRLYKYFSPVWYNMLYICATFGITSCLVIFMKWWFWFVDMPMGPWLMLVYTWVIGTTCYYLLYQWLVKHVSDVYASLIQYMQPIATIVRSVPLLNEKITFLFVVWMVLTLWWVYVLDKSKKSI